jgi:hypothetical protein
MTNAIEAIVEILSWVGLGSGIVVAGLALIAYLVDGTWVPVRGFVENEHDGIIVRWFDEDDAVNQAFLTEEQWRSLGGGGTVEIYARRGYRSRMRAHRGSPIVRGLALLAAILLGVGVVCLVVSLILLFVGG